MSQMPAHDVYLEPFFGSGAVFFNKPKCKIETLNDIDKNITNLFSVIRSNPKELAYGVEFTPYSRECYETSEVSLSAEEVTDLERARLFLVRCWMGRGGKTADKTGWRHNVNPTSTHAVKDWNSLPSQIIQISKQLKDAQIENKDAVDLIKAYNRPDCLIYADPPYLGNTRTKRHYAHEMMQESEHRALLEALNHHQGYVILSGYESDLYEEMLCGWQKVKVTTRTENPKCQKIEVTWLNPAIAHQQRQLTLEI